MKIIEILLLSLLACGSGGAVETTVEQNVEMSGIAVSVQEAVGDDAEEISFAEEVPVAEEAVEIEIVEEVFMAEETHAAAEESVCQEVILPSVDGFAVTDGTDACSVYQSFLEQITWTAGMIEPRFNLCYIDEDDVPELVVFTDLQECEYTHWDLLYTGYDYTLYTIHEGRLTELLTGGMEITPVGGFGDAVVFEPRQNRLLNSTSSYRGAYEEIRQIHNGTVEVVESGYTTYTGCVSGLYVAELYLNGVVRSAFAETEDSPEYAAYLSLSDEINAWKAENDNRQWVRRDPEVSFPVSAENGVQEALAHANA